MRSTLMVLVLASSVACSADRAISPQPRPERTYRWGCDHDGHCGMRLMPLLIIDGKLCSWDMADRTFSTDDIWSVEILKGAKAVMQYGEDARGGVVVIATKAARRQ